MSNTIVSYDFGLSYETKEEPSRAELLRAIRKSKAVYAWVNAIDSYIRVYKNDLEPYVRELDSMPGFRIESESLYID